MPKINISAYAEHLARINQSQSLLPVIEKELLHYEILLALEKAGLLSSLVFQGGTCLRLCYGATRFSEDLDFAGGNAFCASDLWNMKDCLEEILADKLESFVCSRYVRYRDLWDMQWLMRQPGIDCARAHELRKQKEGDYQEADVFKEGLVRIKSQLNVLIESADFAKQMKRFLPHDVYENTIAQVRFREFLLNSIRELYAQY